MSCALIILCRPVSEEAVFCQRLQPRGNVLREVLGIQPEKECVGIGV